MRVYCMWCGLWMTNGSCLHFNVEERLAAEEDRDSKTSETGNGRQAR